jgi:hypothetical protein
MKQINCFYVSALAAIFLLYSCEPALKVTSDYDKTVNFQPYKTFRMVQLDMQHQSISQLNQSRIISAVKSQMTKKGFQEVENPDLKVNAVIILQDKKSVTANTDYYGYGGYYRPYAWGGGMSSSSTTYNVTNYKDGSLIIDIVDAKTDKLVWEGIGNKEIDKPASDPDKAINDAVAQIMAGFPPGAQNKK